jgi:hypothetical protein
MVEINWNAGIEVKEHYPYESMKIGGMLVDASVCANKFRIDEPEFPKIEAQEPGVTLRLDHGRSVRDIVGGVTGGKYDSEKKQLMFEAEIDDPHIQMLAKKGRIKYVSIGATADAFCSKCNKPSGPLRACKCKDAHDVIKNVKLREISIVTDPAYTSAEFKPISFTAALDSALEVTPNSATQVVEGGIQNSNVEENRDMSETKTKTIEATTAASAGPDAVVLLAEMGKKFEEIKKELDAMKAEKKAEEDEKAKKAKEDEEAKKESKKEEVFTKLETILTKLEKKLEKDNECKKDEEEDEAKKKEKPKDGDEDEDDKETKKAKKEATASKGAKVENAEGTEIKAETNGIPTWCAEVAEFARKKGILD